MRERCNKFLTDFSCSLGFDAVHGSPWMTLLQLCGLSIFRGKAADRNSPQKKTWNSRKNRVQLCPQILSLKRVVFALFFLTCPNTRHVLRLFETKLLLDYIYFRPQIICVSPLAFEEIPVLSILSQRNVQTQTKPGKLVVPNHIIITCFRVCFLCMKTKLAFESLLLLSEELGRLWRHNTTEY